MQSALLVILVGLVFGGVGVWILLGQKRLVKICTASVKGIVEDIVQKVNTSKDSDGTRSTSVTFAPTFKYIVNETEYVKTSNASSSHVKLKPDDDVTVYYNPADPNQYYVPEHKTGSVLGVIFTILGISVIMLGIYLTITGNV